MFPLYRLQKLFNSGNSAQNKGKHVLISYFRPPKKGDGFSVTKDGYTVKISLFKWQLMNFRALEVCHQNCPLKQIKGFFLNQNHFFSHNQGETKEVGRLSVHVAG